MENGSLDVGVESCVTSVGYGRLYPTVLGIGVELSVLTPTPAAVGLGIGVERGNGGLDSVVKSWEIISEFIPVLPCVGIPAPRGVGEFGGVMLGRSSVDPAPGVSTDPKRRFLGAVALRDRGRKLYPAPGGRAGTSEAEADPKPSGWSMDEYLIRPLN